jgi:hypothetical protein
MSIIKTAIYNVFTWVDIQINPEIYYRAMVNNGFIVHKGITKEQLWRFFRAG